MVDDPQYPACAALPVEVSMGTGMAEITEGNEV